MVDLLQFFVCWESSKKEFKKLIKALDDVNDQGIRLLALEGLFRIEGDVQRGQLSLDDPEMKQIKDILREWRCKLPHDGAYSGVLGMIPPFLGGFTIFNTLDVPLIDNSVYEIKLEELVKALHVVDMTVALLTLEGLFRIIIPSAGVMQEKGCEFLRRDRDVIEPITTIRELLRAWRSYSLLGGAYSEKFKSVPKILESLTIFKTLEVPLFIDDYGFKKRLSSYENTENIHIDGDTPIFHVTHREEAEGICNDLHFKPSGKNIVEGTWFGLDNSESVYGPYAFETTLAKLGVTGLHQGEIVAYKHEVNVIVYAADDTYSFGVWKPTEEAVRRYDYGAYVKVSVFVPSRFLPKFAGVIHEPAKIKHGPFCVKEKRLGIPCKELTNNSPPHWSRC